MDRIGSANVLGKEEGAGLTVSIGFVSLRNEEKVSVEDLIRRADQALYEAKRTGRNQLRMWASQGADRLV
jgi:diguanylate cyclase (GGDEF)-like protein